MQGTKAAKEQEGTKGTKETKESHARVVVRSKYNGNGSVYNCCTVNMVKYTVYTAVCTANVHTSTVWEQVSDCTKYVHTATHLPVRRPAVAQLLAPCTVIL